MTEVLRMEEFKKILPEICDRETSQDSKRWTPENPLYGHCAVVSLVAQNLFGGALARISLMHIPEFSHMRSQYFNLLPDGSVEDFTREQFGFHYPYGGLIQTQERSYILSNEETKERYKILAWRLAKKIHESNPIFTDRTYKRCFFTALDSPCQKMKFGCAVIYDGQIIHTASNGFIEPLKTLCEPKCIRLSLASRTESMLGACGHAEEFALWEMVRCGIQLNKCDFYIAGIYPNGLPWLEREAGDHTCLRCSVQMNFARVRKIWVPYYNHGWINLSTEQAVKSSLAYATREKKI